MSSYKINKDWIADLTVSPNRMSPTEPPNNYFNNRLFSSIFCFTLGDKLSNHSIENCLLDHIELERQCCNQIDLCLAWSDDVSLTLCFIVSLIHCGGFSTKDLTQKYIDWWMNGFMSPSGVCFAPCTHLEQTIEQMSISQAAEFLGVTDDEKTYTTPPPPPPAALLRISPIAYFYANHSPSARLDIITKCLQAMFGQETSIEIFVIYIELLVKAIKGEEKTSILQSIKVPTNQYNPMAIALIKLLNILRNDDNDIQKGVQQALTYNQAIRRESKWLNPFDSNETLIVTLYLQIGGALYHETIPSEWFTIIYARETLLALTKWLDYERQLNEAKHKNLF